MENRKTGEGLINESNKNKFRLPQKPERTKKIHTAGKVAEAIAFAPWWIVKSIVKKIKKNKEKKRAAKIEREKNIEKTRIMMEEARKKMERCNKPAKKL